MLFTLSIILLGLLIITGIELVLCTVMYGNLTNDLQGWFIVLIILTIIVFIFSAGFYTHFLTAVRPALELGR